MDEGANDSDKTITVPPNTRWKLISTLVELDTTATVGNRTMQKQARDTADDIIFYSRSPTNITASQTADLVYGPDLAVDSFDPPGGDDLYQSKPFPRGPYPQGYDFRILDTAGVDAAADDMIIQMLVEEWIEE